MLSLEPVLATVGGLLQIAFFLAIAFFLFLLWRERRGDLEAWSERNRTLFYAAIVLAVVAIGMAIGLGVPGRDALALVLVAGRLRVRRRARLAARAPLLETLRQREGRALPAGRVPGFTGCTRRSV